MSERIARNLARGVSWSRPTQQILAASPAADLLRSNEHLHSDTFRALLATAPDLGALAHLVRALPPDLARLPDCLDRARSLTSPAGAPRQEPWALPTAGLGALHLDDALSAALARAADEATARAAAARLPPVTGVATAAAAGALGVPAAVANMAPGYLTDWIISPAAAALTDDQVWAVLHQWARSAALVAGAEWLLARALLHRPGLHHRAVGHEAVAIAQLMLGEAAEVVSGGDRAAALDALGAQSRGTASLQLAALAAVGGWDEAQLGRLRLAYVIADVESQLGWAAAPVAAALGVDFTPPGHVAQSLADLRQPEDDPVDFHRLWPVDTAASARHGRAAGPLLAAELADPDPGVEAGRWLVALRLADTFEGTLAELAATATAVHQPTG